MKNQLKKLSKMMRRATRSAKKAVRGATRRVRKFFSRGGARKKKGALRRVTNAISHVGKRIRNTVRGVFSKKNKKRSKKRLVAQHGSAEFVPVPTAANAAPVPTPNTSPFGAASGPAAPML